MIVYSQSTHLTHWENIVSRLFKMALATSSMNPQGQIATSRDDLIVYYAMKGFSTRLMQIILQWSGYVLTKRHIRLAGGKQPKRRASFVKQ